jgi:hypothetical protein
VEEIYAIQSSVDVADELWKKFMSAMDIAVEEFMTSCLLWL